ncbi:MAG: ATP-binding protein [Porphyromonas sp.]|nr:ATP-binding protein [Porphyromonas sp.]
MKLSYKQRLFLYISILFLLFSTGVILFEQARDRKFRTEAMEDRLHAYTEIVNSALIADKGEHSYLLDSLLNLFPQNIRLSLIDTEGNLFYDNSVSDISTLSNHLSRPEIEQARKKGTGSNVRTSDSNSQKYLYYAKRFGNRYVRVALPYNIEVERFMQADHTFFYFVLLLFVCTLVGVNMVSNRFGASIRHLRDFVMQSDRGVVPKLDFPDDELGEIGSKITENYRQLREKTEEIDLERSRLLQHVYSSKEGICFFTPKGDVEFFNGLFIQYLNTLTDELTGEPSIIFKSPDFAEMQNFLNGESEETYFEQMISKQGKSFALRLNKFEDKGFEVILNDVTRQEKTRQLKQEMTANIAHELRTPVTSIRGYLETVMAQNLDADKKQYFISRAFDQTMVLSELIQDIGLITKMEEAPQLFKREEVDLNLLLDRLRHDLISSLEQKKMKIEKLLPEEVFVYGSRNLLYSIFRNLTDNAINYAGEGTTITISLYNEDANFYYFSFSDNGCGISNEEHLPRLFDRFYRISEGRTRETGGSGLGLSIVKNAIAFHKGSITVKNRKGGGLEFLFRLHK